MISNQEGAEVPQPLDSLLGRLRQITDRLLRQELALVTFEGQVGDQDIEHWRQALNELLEMGRIESDLSCLLAYWGVDYLPNICRLLEPYYLRQYAPLTYRERFGDAGPNSAVCRLPGYLALLYRKHRDPNLLWLLLGLRQMRKSWRKAYMDAIASLWHEYSLPLLRAAYGSARRQRNLARALGDICAQLGEDSVWAAYCLDLQRAIHSRDWRLMQTAKRVRVWLHHEKRRLL